MILLPSEVLYSYSIILSPSGFYGIIHDPTPLGSFIPLFYNPTPLISFMELFYDSNPPPPRSYMELFYDSSPLRSFMELFNDPSPLRSFMELFYDPPPQKFFSKSTSPSHSGFPAINNKLVLQGGGIPRKNRGLRPLPL